MGRDIRTLVINFSKNLATERPTEGEENHLPTRSEYRGAWRVVSWWPWWLSWVGAWAARHLCHRLLFHRCPRAVAAVAAVIACEVVVGRDFLVQGDQELVISGLVTSVSSASCLRLYKGLLVTLMRLLSGALLGWVIFHRGCFCWFLLWRACFFTSCQEKAMSLYYNATCKSVPNIRLVGNAERA